MTTKLRVWLWISVVAAVAGAFLLYPIAPAGPAVLNVLFVLIKLGMLAGLLVLIFAKKKAGFCVWAVFSGGAVVMSIVKGCLGAGASFLVVASIIVDILMPVVAWICMKPKIEEFK